MALFNPKNIDIISGVIIIALSLLLFIYSAAAVVSILLILAVIMIFFGLTQILNIRSDNHISEGNNRVVKYLIAILVLLMGISLIINLIIDPISTAIFSIQLVGFVILLIGLSMLYVGSINHDYSKEYRSILMIIGLLTLIFGVVIVIIPSIGFNIIAIVVALPLLFIGLNRLLKGILT